MCTSTALGTCKLNGKNEEKKIVHVPIQINSNRTQYKTITKMDKNEVNVFRKIQLTFQ